MGSTFPHCDFQPIGGAPRRTTGPHIEAASSAILAADTTSPSRFWSSAHAFAACWLVKNLTMGHQASLTLTSEKPPRMKSHQTRGRDESNGLLLGAHILADGAGGVVQAAVIALKYRATIDEIADTYHSYLTMAEGFKLAAQSCGKDVKFLSCCAA